MKKHEISSSGKRSFYLEKILRIMKLTTFLIFINLLHISAIGFSQNERLSLQLKNATLKEMFMAIESQTSYKFLYRDDVIDKQLVTINAEEMPLGEILHTAFDKSESTFRFLENNLIVIAPKQAIQQIKVTGTVIDATTGEPLIGVNVVVEGTTIGAVSDAEGKFAIEVQNQSASLVFSYIGYLAEKVAFSGQSVIEVKMTPDITKLDEVVVVGYGTVKKKDLTGAVSSVQGDAIAGRQATQVSQALQGSMPGVMVTRNNNAPGAGATIRIRGITSIGENNPLIIVDGVPVDNINDINPNDVESISVLKDAASASIYGSRAASGVILVTTKRAKTGEIGLQYNFEYGFEKPTALPEYVDVKRYMQMANELRWNDNNNNANEYPIYAKDVIENYSTLNAENPNKYPNTDWVGLILKNSAPRQSHVLSLTAGTKAIRTKISLAYDKTDALYDGRSYERLTARFNNDVTITKFLSASIDFSYKRSISHQPSMDPIYVTFISAPVYAATWADGRIAEGKTGANIYGQLKEGGYIDNFYNQVGGKISLDFTPFKGFKLSAVVSPNMGFDKGKNFQKKVPYYSADDPTVYIGTTQWGSSTKLTDSRNDYSRVTSQLIANYMKDFGAHSLNFMAGYENFSAFNENMGASRDKYELTNFPYLNLGPLEFRDNSGNAWENAYRSYFGRVMYNYKNKYFLQGNIRYDGSSRFHKDYRWGSFPSFSAGWVLSEEDFMKNISALSFLKIRGSWGSLGNERIGNYPYQATIAFTNALFFQGSNVVAAQTAAQTKYVIQDISWETTESIDLGIDVNFLNNRLKFTGDYFQKTTKDMLLALEIPDYIGFDNPDQNTGKMNTKGWEAEIGWNDHLGDFTYSVSANISDFKSVMGDLGGTQFLGDQIKKEGSEFNEWYGYVTDGLFQTEEDLLASPKLNTAVKVGDVKYLDINGPDGVPDGKISPEYDRKLLGGSLPRYLYATNVKLGYKNFDFSMVWQGVGKVTTRLEGLMVQPLMENWGSVPKLLDGTSWSKYNTPEQNLAAKYPRLTQNNRSNNYTMSDYWLFNGAYLRLKNITLGYNLPVDLARKISLQNIRLYGSASDILTFNKYPKGWDPEVSSTGYPITSSYVFGLSVTF